MTCCFEDLGLGLNVDGGVDGHVTDSIFGLMRAATRPERMQLAHMGSNGLSEASRCDESTDHFSTKAFRKA